MKKKDASTCLPAGVGAVCTEALLDATVAWSGWWHRLFVLLLLNVSPLSESL